MVHFSYKFMYITLYSRNNISSPNTTIVNN